MDLAQVLHKVVDGVAAGNVTDMVMGVALLLGSLVASYLATKAVKFTGRQAYRGAKWLLVPVPESALAASLRQALEVGNMQLDGANLVVDDKVTFYCATNKPKRLDRILVHKPSRTNEKTCMTASDLLTGRDCKRLCRLATQIRNQLRDKHEAKEKAQALDKTLEVVKGIYEPQACFQGQVVYDNTPVTNEPEVQHKAAPKQETASKQALTQQGCAPAVKELKAQRSELCPCPDCSSARTARK